MVDVLGGACGLPGRRVLVGLDPVLVRRTVLVSIRNLTSFPPLHRRIPFYSFARLILFLYLVLPQSQGAISLYQTYVHPWLYEHELEMDEFVANVAERARKTGVAWIKDAIDYVRVSILGMPLDDGRSAAQAHHPALPPADDNSHRFVQSLLSRFYLPSGLVGAAAAAPATPDGQQPPHAPANTPDVLNYALSALSALTQTGYSRAAAGSQDPVGPPAAAYSSGSGFGSRAAPLFTSDVASYIPDSLRDPETRKAKVAAILEQLSPLQSALKSEFFKLQQQETSRREAPALSMGPDDPVTSAEDPFLEGTLGTRPPSGQSGLSGTSGLSKSRSEQDFEKLDGDISGAEDDMGEVRHRARASQQNRPSGWLPRFSWSSSVEK